MKTPSSIRFADLYPTLDEVISYFMNWVDLREDASIVFGFEDRIIELCKKNSVFVLGLMGGVGHPVKKELIRDFISDSVIFIDGFCKFGNCPTSQPIDGVWQMDEYDPDKP